MKKSSQQAVSIVDGQSATRLSPAQQSFNALIQEIGTRRARLQEWEAASDEFQKKYVAQYVPLERELLDLKRQAVHRLHAAWPHKELGKGERITLSAIIADMAQALLQRGDDAELTQIYNQHGEQDEEPDTGTTDEDRRPSAPAASDDVAEDDFTSGTPEEIMQRMEAMLEKQEQERMAASRAREAQRASRKKPPRQRAAEAQREAQRTELSQSIRAVYRRLASALHPDREPDDTERARKTVLMQQVNQAYEKNDLLKLLELQLELEHIDQHSLNDLSEARLAHYNQILQEQLGELDQEILHVERQFRYSYGLAPHARLAPDKVMRYLNRALSALRQEGQDLRVALAAFGDIDQVKAWLKHAKRQRAQGWSEDADGAD
ncbi:J domain-containing protein [Herbaspirillum sp. NPDC087042]|uniref:J domain-containing protein n=1 Tax=Herbaspirillum sp. NPDC087042 TaxID=3364004 RepID=UPI0037FAFFB4